MADYDLRCGDYREVLADVEQVDCLISDPPYSSRTDSGYRSSTDLKGWGGKERKSASARRGDAKGWSLPRTRYELRYKPIDVSWVNEFCDAWLPRTRSWFVVFGDHVSSRWFEGAAQRHSWVTFAPVPWVRTDYAPRFAADGPSNNCEWIMVARPTGLPAIRFARPGYYLGSCKDEKVVTGGKPLWLMRAIVRDYSRPGDLIVDPCAGGGTTLLAALTEGRRAIGAELDPATHALATKRLSRGYTPSLFTDERPAAQQLEIGGEDA